MNISKYAPSEIRPDKVIDKPHRVNTTGINVITKPISIVTSTLIPCLTTCASFSQVSLGKSKFIYVPPKDKIKFDSIGKIKNKIKSIAEASKTIARHSDVIN